MRFKAENLPAWLAGLLAAIIYYMTSAPTITWMHESQDSGELAASAAIAGIPHPTGYPLYMMIGWTAIKMFSWIDPGRVMVLLSVICAAIAAGVIAKACSEAIWTLWGEEGLTRTEAGWFGFLAAITCAIHPVMWSQAVVCEVYSLALMLQAVVWLLLVKYIHVTHSDNWSNAKQIRLVILTGFFLGLILAHHIAGIAIILPIITIFCLSRSGNWLKKFGGFVLSIIPGLVLYLYLPIRSSANPSIDWGNTETFGNFLRHVTAYQYRGNVFGVSWAEFWNRLVNPWWIEDWGISSILLALIYLGLILYPRGKPSQRPLAFAIYFFILCSLVFVISYDSSDYEVFAYLLIVPIGILISLGIAWLFLKISKVHRYVAIFFIIVIFALTMLSVAERWLEMDASSPIRNAAANFVSREISQLPDDALVITNSDGQLFSLMYGITVGITDPMSGEKIGPKKQIDVLTPYWIFTDWYYENETGSDVKIEPWEPDGVRDYKWALRNFVELNLPDRPVFVDGRVLSMIQVEGHEYQIEGRGALMRIIPDE